MVKAKEPHVASLTPPPPPPPRMPLLTWAIVARLGHDTDKGPHVLVLGALGHLPGARERRGDIEAAGRGFRDRREPDNDREKREIQGGPAGGRHRITDVLRELPRFSLLRRP